MGVGHCNCGNEAWMDYISDRGWFIYCPITGGCGRRGSFQGSPEEAVDWWEAELHAINAALYPKPEPEPEPPMNKVYGGEWQVDPIRLRDICTTYLNGVNEFFCRVSDPHTRGQSNFPGVAENTARLMVASKELLRKLKEGRDLYRDGYTSTSLSTYFCSLGEIIDGLGVDVD